MSPCLSCIVVSIFVTTNGFELPHDSHAIFRDSKGVFVLTNNDEILSQMNNGLTPDRIAPNIEMQQFGAQRTLLSVSENEALLDMHNQYRSTTALGGTPGQPAGTNINELFWDPYLANVAQEYSAQCKWEHNPNRAEALNQYEGSTQYLFDSISVSVGENLYYTSVNASVATLVYGIKLYYDEYIYYTFNNDTDGCCQENEACGHYTQVVAANSRYVGCGYTVCPSLQGGSGSNLVFSVCNYFPAGNIGGNSPYFAGCACSNCASDRICNEDGLCGGCASLSYAYCSDYYSNCEDLVSSCPAEGCDLDSTENLCMRCRTSCGSCTADMLSPVSACNDGVSSDLSGTFGGNDIVVPTDESAFSGSPFCDGDAIITVCAACTQSLFFNTVSALMSVFLVISQ